MKITKEQINQLVRSVIREQKLSRGNAEMKTSATGASESDRDKRNRETQEKRSRMKATARGMNEELIQDEEEQILKELEEACSCHLQDQEDDQEDWMDGYNTVERLDLQRPQKITSEQIVTMVREAMLKEANNNDFSAKRQIILAAQNASMDFEKEIVKGLDLVGPDDMSDPRIQEKYLQIVKEMEGGVVASVAKAVKQLVAFPRNSQNDGGNNTASTQAAPVAPGDDFPI